MPKSQTALPTLIDALLAANLYLALEWLFFVTKPSFLNVLSWGEQLVVLFVSALPVLLLMATIWVLSALAVLLLTPILPPRLRVIILRLPQALAITGLLVLFFDNVTYSALKFGILKAWGGWAIAYVFAILGLFLIVLERLSAPSMQSNSVPAWKWLPTLGLPLIGVLLAVQGSMNTKSLAMPEFESSAARPNILFFATDGVEADFLSGYGFDKETSPRLDALMDESLVFDAAFSNDAHTGGSTVSMLTGRYPSSTKMIIPPHALLGVDAFHHLPGILRARGYSTFQESILYYADGADLNMQAGFDVANRLKNPYRVASWLAGKDLTAWSDVLYFVYRLERRLEKRVMHLLRPGNSPLVVFPTRSDGPRIEAAKAFMKAQDGPFMMHIHLMDTHCCNFKPRKRVFSKGLGAPNKENRDIFFLDTVLGSDRYFGELLDTLAELGALENTLIIYSSDHSKGWKVNRRMPLVIRFPDRRQVGREHGNVQLMDVTPTVLDLLEVPIPAWIEGQSLLASDIDPLRPVFTVSQASEALDLGPPLYGIESFTMIVCHQWFEMDMATGEVQSGWVENHPKPCALGDLPSKGEARQSMVRHLMERGMTPPVSAYSSLD